MKLPQDYVNRIKEMLGEEYQEFIDSYNELCKLSMRFNPLKGEANKKNIEYGDIAVLWEENGSYIKESDEPGRSPLHNAGAYYIQEASAMAPVHFLAPEPGERVLDLCAAPGGKSTQIASYMKGSGLLISNEPVPNRAKILSENLERFGVVNSVVVSGDPSELSPRFPEFFHRILVDAPCSGEGMFRKHPEAALEWSLDNVEMCARRQASILDDAAKMLMPGGRLVYSTCTFAPLEDEQAVVEFLIRNPEFKPAVIGEEYGMVHGQAKWVDKERLISLIEACGDGKANIDISEIDVFIEAAMGCTLRLWPHRLQGEGHFLAVLQKDGEIMSTKIDHAYQQPAEATNLRAGKKDKQNKKNRDARVKGSDISPIELYREFAKGLYDNRSEGDESNSYVNLNSNDITLLGENLYILPSMLPNLNGIKTYRQGLHLGSVTKGRFEPAHALAMVLSGDNYDRWIEVDETVAENYLKGLTFSENDCSSICPCGIEKGWYLVCYKGYSIGWARYAGGIFKNYYPKGLRLK